MSLQCKQLGLGILSWYQAETVAFFQSDSPECQVTYNHTNSNSSIGMPNIHSSHTDHHGRACFLQSMFVKSCANEKEHPDQDDYACCQGMLFATWNLTVEEKCTKFSGKPRDARENRGIQPIFGRILSKIVMKIQNRALPNFQILALRV